MRRGHKHDHGDNRDDDRKHDRDEEDDDDDDDDAGRDWESRDGSALRKIGQLIFIRHGEKISDEHPDLAKQGQFRADNLHLIFDEGKTPVGKYNTPDIIYAMKTKEEAGASTRPFDTIAPLGRKLGMKPIPGSRTGQDTGKIFDARFKKKKLDKLYEDLSQHADGSYKGKTVLFCWEHRTIPLILDDFGINPLGKPLNWGLNPEAPEDESANYTAIWVINPGCKKWDQNYFKVYQQFEVDPNQCDSLGHISEPDDAKNVAFQVKAPPGGYGKAVYTNTAKKPADEDDEDK